MVHSFRTRIFVIMGSLIVVISGVLIYFGQREIQKAMLNAAENEAQNAMNLAFLTIETQYDDLVHYKQSLLDIHKQELVNLTSVAENYLQEFYRKYKTGKLSEQEAQAQGLEGLRHFTYGNNDYFWVADYNSVLLSHPDPDVNGADFSQKKGARGTLIVPPMVEGARQYGDGFHSYWWTRLGSEEQIEKLSYYRHFPEWKWVLGTGIYIDDIEKATQQWGERMLAGLEAALAKITIARTGYLYVFDANRQMLIHPVLRGEQAADLKNPQTGQVLLDELMKAAVTPDVPFEYLWDRPNSEGEYRFQKQSYVRCFEPLGWYVASSVYIDELLQPARRLLQKLLLVFLGFLVVVVVISILLANSLTRPIKYIVDRVKILSAYDLTTEFDEQISRTEFGLLSKYLNQMLRSFREVVGQVQRSGIQVTSSATELSATAKEQEATMTAQVQATNRVVNSVREISEVAASLAETMQHVASMLQNATGFASTGQSDLLHMEEAMRHMEEASKSISGRLEAISEKAENITTVVTTINKVAEQTNLLSLNAAIEAEKAGEYGRGFTVVAREIRRLADQTAVATLDIERMVREMQSAVSSGIMEMDKFIAEVRHSAEDVGKISMQLSLIIEQVQALAPNFDQVNSSMEQQSKNAQKINNAIEHLSEEMQQTRDALHETYSAIEQLNEAARGLQNQVSRFKIIL